MGADLTLAITDAPTVEQLAESNRPNLYRALDIAVAEASDNTINLILDELWSDIDLDISREDILERAYKALDNLLNDNRDVVYTLIHEYPVWISGGMSWGDTPSESYEDVVLIDWLSPSWFGMEEQYIHDLIEIVYTLIGNQQTDSEVGDERWREADELSERVEAIDTWIRKKDR